MAFEELKNIVGKNEEQLKAIKDQGKKQLQVLTEKLDKEVDLKNVFFKNNLNSESIRAYNEIKEQSKKINYTKLVYNGLGKLNYNFTIFLNLGCFAGSIYNGSLLRKAVKI